MGQTNIGFYIQGKIPPLSDFSILQDGNPGIGGTEYLVLLLAEHLALDIDNSVTLYLHNAISGLPSKIHQSIVCSFEEAITVHSSLPVPLMICGPQQIIGRWRLSSLATASGVRFILWAHIEFYHRKEVMLFAGCNAVKRIVFLTPHSYARYSAKIRRKGIIIGHPAVHSDVPKRNQFRNEIVYLGALVPLRKCENLLKVLPDIVLRFPDVHLTVLGGGNLYDRSDSLGDSGIASPAYEKVLLEIVEKNGLWPYVSFKGNVSPSSFASLINNAAIGVTNLRYEGNETFCLSAVEMGSYGLPVIAGDIGGLKDTLPRRCGFRVKNNKQLTSKIERLLKNRKENLKKGERYRSFVEANYKPSIFFRSWDFLINDTANVESPPHQKTSLRYFPLIVVCRVRNFIGRILRKIIAVVKR